MDAMYAFFYALGIVPTFQWTYRAGRRDGPGPDPGAWMIAFCAAAAWFLAVPCAKVYRWVR